MVASPNVFRDVPGSVMDDSGRSVFPFFVEGDSFLLSLFADESLDHRFSGQILPYNYLLEKNILRLNEGHREMAFVFFEDIGSAYAKSEYLSYLRSHSISYIKQTLNIPVYLIPTCDVTYYNFQRNISPLFHIIGDGYLTSDQLQRVSDLSSFGNGMNFDYDSLKSKLVQTTQYLSHHEVRVIRLTEINSGGGMLTGLIVTPNDTEPIHADNVEPQEVTRTKASDQIDLATFEAISTQLHAACEKKQPGYPISSRLGLAATSAVHLLQNSKLANKEAYMALFLIHATLLDELSLDSRAQPDELITSSNNQAKKYAAELNQILKELYHSLNYYAFEVSKENSTASETLLTRGAEAIRDFIDGRLLHRLLILQLEDELKSTNDILNTTFEVVSSLSGKKISLQSLSALGTPLKTVSKSTASYPSILDEFTSFKENSDASQSQRLLDSWSILPETDPILVRILLTATSEKNIDSLINLQPGSSSKSSEKSHTKTTTEQVDDWEEEVAEPEAADDWEEAADDWEETADDWEEAEEEVKDEPIPDQKVKQSQSQKTTSDNASSATLLGGPLHVRDINEKFSWDSDKPLPDGASMKIGARERQLEVNPVYLRPSTKYMFRKFLEQHRTMKNGMLAYTMPSDQDIRDRLKFVSRELTFEKAQLWLKSAIEIRVRKFENRAITRAESTKDHYVQSMNIPSKIILRDIVETGANEEEDEKDNTNKSSNGNKKKIELKKTKASTKPKQLSIKEKAAQETNERLAQQAFTEVERFINVSLKQSRLPLEKKVEKLDDKLISSSDIPSTFFGLMELLRMRVQLWKERVENKSRATVNVVSSAGVDAVTDQQMEAAVRLLQLLNDLARRFIQVMKPSDVEEVQRAYAMLGFVNSAVEIVDLWANANNITDTQLIEKLTSPYTGKVHVERRYAVGTSRSRFIMQFAGHTLLRNVYSARDSRVSGFYPDKWQRKLLDIVDNNESSLVVAPTSAGKTLVSFYTVDKITRENKEIKNPSHRGVVIFIAPTFALARQMESDIMMRSKATVYLHDTHTKLPASMNFDVLITLPACMENIMFSPERVNWLTRVRYVVFDEVHSIGSTLTGPTWERIFLLIHQSPFLALSATVGGANRFHEWLQFMRSTYNLVNENDPKKITVGGFTMSTEKFPKPAVHFVSTSIRWSHLHHYFYVPSLTFMNEAGRQVLGKDVDIITSDNQIGLSQNHGQFIPIHPCGTVAFEKPEIRTDVSLLTNVEFSTSDTLKLYDAMVTVAQKSPRFMNAAKNEPNLVKLYERLTINLNPDTYFGFFVEKIHTLKYEEQLKELLQDWHDAVLDTEILEVVDSLGGSFKRILDPLVIATRARRQAWIKQTLPMLRELEQREWFPALIFCLDRSLCTELAEYVNAQLEEEEQQAWIKEKDPRVNKEEFIEERLRQVKAYKKMQERKSKIKGNAELAKEEEELEKMGLGAADLSGPEPKPIDLSQWNSWKPDERFSFVRDNETMNAKDLEYWSSKVSKKGRSHLTGEHPHIKALFRGFGIHHNGVDKSYRDLVEVMFRGRNIKFVFATEGLGLGVNMPCRTTVFAFNSPGLNPLNYRQMSGRAGRRGFDDKGQVIFYAIDPRTCCRLMTSSLSELHGHFNLSLDAVLRGVLKYFHLKEKTINIQQKTTNSVALLDLENFVLRSFYAFGEKTPLSIRLAHAHHIRFCLTYFQHLQLFKKNSPTGLAYLLSVVSNNLTSNGSQCGTFLFGYLLRRGVIDKLCENFDKDPEETAKKLMVVLCHIFYPILLRTGSPISDISGTDFYSLPHLESVDADVANAVKEHNQFALTLYSRYAAATALTSIDKEKAYTLPLSHVTFDINSKSSQTSPLSQLIEKSAIPAHIRSPFLTLSGKGDDFKSLSELASTIRSDVHFSTEQLPIDLSILKEGAVLSGYALDYYMNGNYDRIIEIHGIDKSVAWLTLHNFRRLLHVLKTFTFKLSQEQYDDEDSGAEESDEEDTTVISAFDKRTVTTVQHVQYAALPDESRKSARVLKHIYDKFDQFLSSVDRSTTVNV